MVATKRKRDATAIDAEAVEKTNTAKKAKAPRPRKAPTPSAFPIQLTTSDGQLTIQIIAGSYDRVLHGITTTIRPSTSPSSTSTKKSKQNVEKPTKPKAELSTGRRWW